MGRGRFSDTGPSHEVTLAAPKSLGKIRDQHHYTRSYELENGFPSGKKIGEHTGTSCTVIEFTLPQLDPYTPPNRRDCDNMYRTHDAHERSKVMGTPQTIRGYHT